MIASEFRGLIKRLQLQTDLAARILSGVEGLSVAEEHLHRTQVRVCRSGNLESDSFLTRLAPCVMMATNFPLEKPA